MTEGAIDESDARIHEYMLGRPILRAHSRFVVVKDLAGRETGENIAGDRLVLMKFANMVTQVLVARVTEQLELGSIYAGDQPVAVTPMQANRSVVEKVSEIVQFGGVSVFPPVRITRRRSPLRI